MLEAAERTLANALVGGGELRRWSDDEFLLVDRECPCEAAKRAPALAGIARTTDFRWRGDRISITASIGLAVGDPGNRRISILVKNEGPVAASIPEIRHVEARAVKAPALGAKPSAAASR